MSKTLCVASVALFLMTMRTAAHHAFAAEYDENKRVSVSGTVTKFQWTNPHAWLYVDGKDESGKVNLELRNGQSQRPCSPGLEKGGVEAGR